MAAPVAVRTYAAILAAPLGLHAKLGVCIQQQAVSSIDFLSLRHADLAPTTAFAQRVVDQLLRYFTHPRHTFSTPLLLQGTPFQQRVWQALLNLSAGETISYGALATQLATGARAVGNACRANPVPIIVPCHRIVACDGLGGYSGAIAGTQLGIKRWLLEHERQPI